MAKEPDFVKIFDPTSFPYEVLELESEQVLKWINSDDEPLEELVEAISNVNARLRDEPGFVIIRIAPEK